MPSDELKKLRQSIEKSLKVMEGAKGAIPKPYVPEEETEEGRTEQPTPTTEEAPSE